MSSPSLLFAQLVPVRRLPAAMLVVVCLPAILVCSPPDSDPAGAKDDRSPELVEQGKKFGAYREALPPLKAPRKGEQYNLVVEYLEDPLLPTFDDKQLKELLHKTEDYAREYLDMKVKLRLRQRRSIDEFFKSRAADFDHPVFSYPARAWHIDLAAPGANDKIKDAIREGIRDRPEDLLEEYFGPIPDDPEEYVDRITLHFHERMKGIMGELDASGKPLYDPVKNPRREKQISYGYWNTLLWQEKDVDFYLTNTILATPDTGMPLYVINRGGITTAFVENNEHRPYQGVTMMGAYPILSEGAYFKKVRGSWTTEEKQDAIAFIILHELGHLLLRKNENFTLDGSIHRAPIDLDYVSWARRVKADHKKKDHSGISLLKRF